MGKWTDALTSGNFKQAKGKLYDGVGYCCLGVREHIEGIEFAEHITGNFTDEYSCWTMPASDVLHDWGLENALSSVEFEEIVPFITATTKSPTKKKRVQTAYSKTDDEYTPADVLATMNDNGYTFKQIAKVIKRFGWEK